MTGTARTLRVAVVAQNIVSADGQGRFALEVARQLAEGGHSVTAFTHALADELLGRVSLRSIPISSGPQLLDDLVFLLRASAAVRRMRPDVVFAVGPTVLTGRPLVVDAQFSHRQWSRLWGPHLVPSPAHRVHTVAAATLESRVMRRADKLLAPTQELAAAIDSPRAASGTALVPNGVDPGEFEGISFSERAASRERFGIDADAFVVAFLGEYQTHRKGLEPLMDAVGRISGVHLLVAGRGPDLSTAVAGHGLEGRVHVAGFADARSVLAAADVAAVPSWYEPFSLVALEAAASGLPVILSAAVGAAAHLGDAALVVERPDGELLASALESLRDDPSLRLRLGESGRAVAAALAWPKVSGQVVQVIEEVAGERATTNDRARLRIAYVTDTMADIRMLEGLAAGAEVTVVAPSMLGERVTNFWPPRHPAVVHKVLLPGGRVTFVPRAAAWLARNQRSFDVVFALDNLVAALAANIGTAMGGPPAVLQVGRPTMDYLRCQPPSGRTTVRRLVARLLVAVNERRAAGIGAVSDYCAAQCAQRNANVVSIPWYGVDVERFRATTDKAAARRQLGLPVDRPIVMLRSRLAPEKDPETFLEAIGLIRARGRDVCAVYMGGELEELEHAVARSGVEVIGRKPTDVDEIPLWYVAADVNVQTSHAEGLGVSPLESLACGTPVVVSAVGGLPEVVDGGRVGGLVAHGDAAATAEAIESFLDDPALAARVGAEGRAFVTERYSSERAFNAWLDLASGVAAPRRRMRRRRRARGDHVVGDAGADPQPVRVLFVDHDWRLSGGERDLVDLIRGFPRAAVEAHVALPAEGPLADALRAEGATVHLIDMQEDLRRVSRWDLATSPLLAARFAANAGASALRLARLARRVAPDVVHSNSMKAHVLAVPAAMYIRRPLVWHVRDILEPGWLRRAFTALGGTSASAILCISQAVASSMLGTRAEPKLRVVYNGVRPTTPTDDAVDSARRQLGAGADDIVVGIVGQIAHWKGQDVLISAAEILSRDLPEARFAVVGDCLFPENESEYADGLRHQAARLGIEDRVVFAGQIEPIEPVMAALDVLVHASRLPEPFGRVVVEAMSLGTPVITTDIGAGPELVPEGAGAIVPPDDPPALAAAVRRIAPDRASAGSHAAAARDAAAGFDIGSTAASTLEVYRSIGVTSGQDPR